MTSFTQTLISSGRRLKLSALLLIVIVAGAIPAWAVDMTGGVRDENGRPAVGVSVSLIGTGGILQSTVTDPRGNYFFVNPPAGKYSVLLEARDFQTTRYNNVTVKQYQYLLYDFKVLRGARTPIVEIDAKSAYGSITARILNHDGSPAVGVDVAAVTAADVARERPAQLIAVNMTDAAARTDNEGRIRIDDLLPGRYLLSVGLVVYPNPNCADDGDCMKPLPSMWRPAYGPEDGTITVSAGTDSVTEFRLPPPAPSTAAPGFRIAGRAQDAPPLFARDHRGPPTKANLTGVVKLYASSCPPSPFKQKSAQPTPRAVAPIAADGTFEFRDVPAGKYALCVSIGPAPHVAGPSVTISKNDVVNLVLPRMRSNNAAGPLPTLEGSGPLTLDLPRIEQAAKLERESRDKAEQEKLKKAQKK